MDDATISSPRSPYSDIELGYIQAVFVDCFLHSGLFSALLLKSPTPRDGSNLGGDSGSVLSIHVESHNPL